MELPQMPQPVLYEVPPPYPPTLPFQQHLEDPRSRGESVGSPNGHKTGSGGEGGEGEGEDYSPRGSRSFKRHDPPVNDQGKYYCNFSVECDGQTFDRKCEWR